MEGRIERKRERGSERDREREGERERERERMKQPPGRRRIKAGVQSIIPAAFEHPVSASELVVAKINVSLMARVIFHYVQFARELLRRRRRAARGCKEKRSGVGRSSGSRK